MNSADRLLVLLTCRELAVRAGSQLYTRDVAEVLRALGHSPVVYAPRLGPVADELRRRGVPVIDRLERLGEEPSIIHGQHHVEAMAAMLRFPRTPAIFVCHGWLPWQEAPPHFPSIMRYVAVDRLRRDRLVLEHGIAPEQVEVLHNFVDLDRFRPRGPLPERPRRALLLSNQATEDSLLLGVVRAACVRHGIELAAVGAGLGRAAAMPETLLPHYDLVFGRGRAALEAMAVGLAVVLCDAEGVGPLVSAGNFDRLRDLNFGLLALPGALDADTLAAEVALYDPSEAARVSARVRGEHDRRDAVLRLLDLYRRAIAEAPSPAERSSTAYAERCLRAAADYVAWATGEIDSHLDRARERVALAEQAEADLARLERSPFLRLRKRLLGWTPLVATYRRFKPSR